MLFSGQGPVFHANRDANGDPIEFVWFGNAPSFTLGLATATLTHKESYTGNRTTDARIITELTATVAITVDDFKESNLELATYGEGSAVAGRLTEFARALLQTWTNRRRCSSCKSTIARTARERYCRLDDMSKA